jgi:ABC-type sugar transport system permease subunit
MANAAADGKKESIFFKKGFRESVDAFLFISPFMIGVIIFQLYVFISGFYLSLTDASGGVSVPNFIGFGNYIQLWKEIVTGGDFFKAAIITFQFELGCLVTQIPVAFVLAFVLNSLPYKRLQTSLRTAFFIPCLINSIITGWLFTQIFNPDQGFINYFLGVLGLLKVDPNTHLLIPILWAHDKNLVIPILIIVTFWQWTGYHMVYFLSQLQTIDPNLYEAAKIDGASSLQIITKITLPLMRPALAFVMITSMVGGLLVFDIIYIIFPAATGIFGPGDSAKALMPYIYFNAFDTTPARIGLASAAGWFKPRGGIIWLIIIKIR